jgi:hypothetical protein
MEAPPSPLSSRPKWRACPERSRMGICSSLNQQPIRMEAFASRFVASHPCRKSTVKDGAPMDLMHFNAVNCCKSSQGLGNLAARPRYTADDYDLCQINEERPEKAKGRFLLRDIALPVRICQRSGSASKSQRCYSKIIRVPRAKPAFPSFFQYHFVVRASLPPCIGFQLPGRFTGFVTDSLDDYSLLSSSGRSLFR